MFDLLFTKTFWSGLALVASGVFTIIKTNDWMSGIDKIIAGLGLIFVRDAIRKMEV